jgi:hypothetical protein
MPHSSKEFNLEQSIVEKPKNRAAAAAAASVLDQQH